MTKKFAFVITLAAALTLECVSGFAQDAGSTAAKPSLGALGNCASTAMKPRVKGDAQAAGSVGRFSSGELVATAFTVNANSCVDFDSAQDLTGADRVAITILALNFDLSNTEILPLFAVPNSPFFSSSGEVLSGSNFVFSDGGGGTVAVSGSDLKIRVCNNSKNAIRYDQLSAYATGAQFAGNHI